MSMGTGSISGFLCQDLDMMGRERMFDQERCVELQTRAAQEDDPCGCHPSTPSKCCITEKKKSISFSHFFVLVM